MKRKISSCSCLRNILVLSIIMIVIQRNLIENFRLKQVYNKRVIEEMYCGGWSGWDNTDESRDYINKMLTWLNDN